MTRLRVAGQRPIDDPATWLACGGAVVALDSRRNEGLMVFGAAYATTDLMAFAVRHGTGYLRVAISPDVADRLNLPPMHNSFRQSGQGGFTVSVDARYAVGTGISAHDRACTARLIADPNAQPDDFTRPGHLLPVVAGPRDGDGESAVACQALALVDAAGLTAAAVYSELVSVQDPTTIMAADEAGAFARSVGIPAIWMPNTDPQHSRSRNGRNTMNDRHVGENPAPVFPRTPSGGQQPAHLAAVVPILS
ncbi:3,4-dihydroxy-2-butanone-4-phosphate synthase [Rhodococcus sp. IEGM 248]|jgi:3,4-dihydroxy 2-butanone 4-phosphate synthase/GTP cyclohydrolase II|uniref:3,4-dihydroxy-2-butanone-4-phosphate synthase n=1 Tax=Rhodococcus sp. IEGM 1305 TaxID=3047092 RepID=UPI0013C21BA1|nr:3,4-dihydroxy-2-butanone-4-phosphate synthase [Rhodococcus sp. IEGM 1305]MDI9949253.1 3,4-dihydroxy-2-butanone-4-phosphate synthase [Rhodococcus sp. IEGM 1305]NDV07983.1 3,4-dihydroxy-2-butanone-4-phosphate synthase [Rhodococcus sp. IEGM 248]